MSALYPTDYKALHGDLHVRPIVEGLVYAVGGVLAMGVLFTMAGYAAIKTLEKGFPNATKDEWPS